MRIGILTDIHANIDALEAVLRRLDEERIDKLCCLGDTVGYGAAPEACCTAMRENADWTVLGNHDAAVAERMEYDYYYSSARDALNLHRELLSEENREWLRNLPWSVEFETLGFCHARPDDPEAFQYVFSVEQATELAASADELHDVTFIGHSHLVRVFSMARSGDRPIVQQLQGDVLTLEPGPNYLVSCGSVGQPRDMDPRASCAVFDTDTRELQLLRVSYDVGRAARRIYDTPKLAAEFAKRLFLGV